MKQPKTAALSLTFAAALGITLSACDAESTLNYGEQGATGEQEEVREVTVARVIDGDTVAVEPTEELEATNDAGTEHSVRVLGLDAPEMNFYSDEPPECGAEAATAFTEDMLSPGDQVRLVFDPVADEQDRYGRSLAYVETSEGEDLGHQLVQEGLAWAWYPSSAPEPTRYNDYTSAEEQAEEQGTGSWGICETLGEESP